MVQNIYPKTRDSGREQIFIYNNAKNEYYKKKLKLQKLQIR